MQNNSASTRANGENLPQLDMSGASAHETASFDHFIGAQEKRLRNSEADCLRGLEIDQKVEFGRLLYRNVARLLAFDYFIGQGRRSHAKRHLIGAVRDKRTALERFARKRA